MRYKTSFCSLIASGLFLVAVVSAAVSAAGEQKFKKVDPSGSWRWQHEEEGEAIKDLLRIRIDKEGKVVGTYQGRIGPLEIKKGKMEGDQLSFQFAIDAGGQQIDIKFAGKIKDDDIEGTVAFVAATGSGEFPWKAKRSVDLSDVLGKWRIRIETDGGEVLERELDVSKSGKDIKAVYKGQGAEYPVRDLKVKDNKLTFAVNIDFNGNPLVAKYAGRPYGDKLAGTLNFEIGGNTGEVDFTATREPKTKSIEEKTQIHRLASTKRSLYDAFVYVNRIPEAAEEGESGIDVAGRIFGRLANQEGRILLKLPPGMDRDSYLALKTFFRYEGEAKVGNCGACHIPAEFTDSKKHVVTKGGSPTLTPALRNLKKRNVDLRKAIMAKLTASHQKRSGKADEIDSAYAEMNISEKDVPGLVAFLKLLGDVPDSGFRELILNAKLLDTSGDIE